MSYKIEKKDCTNITQFEMNFDHNKKIALGVSNR